MRKSAIIILLNMLIFTSGKSQEYTPQLVDSITYRHYINGSWDSLISVCRTVYKTTDIDFMFLRQRLGYAYFMKQNYALSKYHYERSLRFDASDATSVYYLYLNGLYSGDDGYARFYARKLDKTTQKTENLHAFRILNLMDAEYNFKMGSELYERSSTHYMRLGLGTQPGYRFSLYQSVSDFKQQFYRILNVKQQSYFALLTYKLKANLSLSAGVHFIKTGLNDTASYNSTLLLAKLAYGKHRFDGSLQGSVYKTTTETTAQLTLHGGISLPEIKHLYLYADFSSLKYNAEANFVTKLGLGLAPFNRTWIDLNVVNGKQLNFIDFNGLYVYNSTDYLQLKSSASLYYYLNKNITLVTNYILEKRTAADFSTSNTYYQHSITGGFIWKF